MEPESNSVSMGGMRFDAEYLAEFYDAYGMAEWLRLEKSAYNRLQAIIHADFIEAYVRSGDRVLDAGSGPGRFSLVMAQLGARVTVLDMSRRQLEIAQEHIAAAGLLERIDGFHQADIRDLSGFPEGRFDAVVCFGGALSYVCEVRGRAARQLLRVVRPGGFLLVSVMSRFGNAANVVRRPSLPILQDPEGWNLWRVIDQGDAPPFPSQTLQMKHPAMHMYSAGELRELFPMCEVLELAGSNVTVFEGSQAFEDVAQHPVAWSTAVEVERRLNRIPGLVDSGSHLILAAKRSD